MQKLTYSSNGKKKIFYEYNIQNKEIEMESYYEKQIRYNVTLMIKVQFKVSCLRDHQMNKCSLLQEYYFVGI